MLRFATNQFVLRLFVEVRNPWSKGSGLGRGSVGAGDFSQNHLRAEESMTSDPEIPATCSHIANGAIRYLWHKHGAVTRFQWCAVCLHITD